MSKKFLAQYGTPAIQDKLLNDQHDITRVALATHGTDKHRDILMNDRDKYVRQAVAYHGTDKHRDFLVHDDEPMVRHTVAQQGNDNHIDILSKDRDDHYLKSIVAKKGNLHHALDLVGDHETRDTKLNAYQNIQRRFKHMTDEEIEPYRKHPNTGVKNIANGTIDSRKTMDRFFEENKDDPLFKDK